MLSPKKYSSWPNKARWRWWQGPTQLAAWQELAIPTTQPRSTDKVVCLLPGENKMWPVESRDNDDGDDDDASEQTKMMMMMETTTT